MSAEPVESNGPQDAAAPEEVGTPVAVFTIGREAFAVPLEDVAEIVRTRDITPLPLAPSFLAGVINLHGNLASVISLAEALGVDSDGSGGLLVMLVPEKGGFAVMVDQTAGFEAFTTLDEVTRDAGGPDKEVVFLEGVFRVSSRLVSLINPDKLRVWIDGEFAKGDN